MAALKRYGSLLFAVVGVGIAVFWLASAVWLMGKTSSRPITKSRSVSYSSLLDTFQGELRYEIRHGQNRIGDIVYRNFRSLSGRAVSWILNLGITSQAVGGAKASGFAMLDADGTLQSFEVELEMVGKTSSIRGRAENGMMALDYEGIGALPAGLIPMDSTMTVSDGFLPGLPGICPEPGERLSWQVFDPLSMQPQEVTLAQHDGDILPPPPSGGCVLVMSHGDLETLIWVDGSGLVTRERTSLGLELELANWARDGEEPENIPPLFPRMIGTVEGPPWPSRLVVEIIPEERLPLSGRQTRELESGFYLLRSEETTTTRDRSFESSVLSRASIGPESLRSFDASPPVDRALRSALSTQPHTHSPVESLARWVMQSIQQGPPLWPVSVEETLEKERGDCLARAVVLEHLLETVGYRAEICYGLSLRDDTPRFHAWVRVCEDDRCLEIDPSVEELVPDATMLCIKRGQVAGSPYRLLQIIGTTTVRIVEVQYI